MPLPVQFCLCFKKQSLKCHSSCHSLHDFILEKAIFCNLSRHFSNDFIATFSHFRKDKPISVKKIPIKAVSQSNSITKWRKFLQKRGRNNFYTNITNTIEKELLQKVRRAKNSLTQILAKNKTKQKHRKAKNYVKMISTLSKADFCIKNN